MKLINAYGLTREQSTSSDEYFPMNISDFKNVDELFCGRGEHPTPCCETDSSSNKLFTLITAITPYKYVDF